MKKTQSKWITYCATGALAATFYLLSGLPHPAAATDQPGAAWAVSAVTGSGAFKHNLYFGNGRDSLRGASQEQLLLLTRYGG